MPCVALHLAYSSSPRALPCLLYNTPPCDFDDVLCLCDAGYFSQFGRLKHVRLSRSKKTGAPCSSSSH